MRDSPAAPPGRLRRALGGAWYVPAGFAFLARRPRLWPLAALPAVLAAALVVAGLLSGLFALGPVEAALVPRPPRVPDALVFPLTLALWVATLGAGMLLGLALGLALTAPVLERLSRRVERLVPGAPAAPETSIRWELLQSAKAAGYFALAAPGLFLLGLVPLAGPFAAALWGAHALALQETDSPLARRGLDFAARRGWHRRFRPESLGFGLAALVTLVVPIANLLLAPALTVGATLLVLELQDGASAGGREPARPIA